MVSLLRNFVVSLQAILAQPLIFIRFPPYVRFYLAMVFLYMTVLVAFLYALLAYPFFSAFGRRSFLQYTIGRLWWHIQAPIFRLCIVVEGEENMLRWVGGRESGGPCIFVANHQSELDLLIMAKVCTLILMPLYQAYYLHAALATLYGDLCDVEGQKIACVGSNFGHLPYNLRGSTPFLRPNKWSDLTQCCPHNA
jgi:hypothetical protein